MSESNFEIVKRLHGTVASEDNAYYTSALEFLLRDFEKLKASLIEQGKERDELLAIVKRGLNILKKSEMPNSIYSRSFLHDDMRLLVDKIESE